MKEIDKKIKTANKKILKSTSNGILKISFAVLPFLILGIAIGTSITGFVKGAETKKAYEEFKNGENYISMQENDIEILENQYKNGDVNALQYEEALNYIHGDEYFNDIMEKDAQFQELLKKQKIYDGLAIGGATVGFASFLVSLMMVLSSSVVSLQIDSKRDFKSAKRYLNSKKKKLIPLKKYGTLNIDNLSNEKIEDLESEFYNKK